MAARLELRCPDHPTYRGFARPRAKCAACVELYQHRDPETRMPEFGYVKQGDGTWARSG